MRNSEECVILYAAPGDNHCTFPFMICNPSIQNMLKANIKDTRMIIFIIRAKFTYCFIFISVDFEHVLALRERQTFSQLFIIFQKEEMKFSNCPCGNFVSPPKALKAVRYSYCFFIKY